MIIIYYDGQGSVYLQSVWIYYYNDSGFIYRVIINTVVIEKLYCIIIYYIINACFGFILYWIWDTIYVVRLINRFDNNILFNSQKCIIIIIIFRYTIYCILYILYVYVYVYYINKIIQLCCKWIRNNVRREGCIFPQVTRSNNIIMIITKWNIISCVSVEDDNDV